MNILALGSVDEIQAAISREDATYLSAVQGIGKKTAERMVVELKSKVSKIKDTDTSHPSSAAIAEVIDALVSMGYDKGEVRNLAKHLEGDDIEKLLRKALTLLAK